MYIAAVLSPTASSMTGSSLFSGSWLRSLFTFAETCVSTSLGSEPSRTYAWMLDTPARLVDRM